MNDSLLTNVQVAMNHASSAVWYLDKMCKDCKAKERCNRIFRRCSIGQARIRMVSASRLLSEIIDRRKEDAE